MQKLYKKLEKTKNDTTFAQFIYYIVVFGL